MLQRLYIQNYALIKSLDIEFNEGFTVITGETGAGKSILLGALNLILGKRADAAALLDKSMKCVVEATFNLNHYGLKPLFDQHDLDYDEQSIFRREINAGGKSRAFINDTPVNLNQLKTIGEKLVNIHSQDEQILLGDSGFQLAVVDSFAGLNEQQLAYKTHYKQYVSSRHQLQQLIEQQKRASAEKDFLQFLYQELEEAKLRPNEQENLEEEQELLNHTEEIKGILFQASQHLNDESQGILNRLSALKNSFEKISGYSQSINEITQRISSAYIDLADIADEIDRFDSTVNHDPRRVAEIKERLDTLYNLQSKHRVNSMEALMQVMNDIDEKLNHIQNLDGEIEKLQASLHKTETTLINQATQLSNRRTDVFKTMQVAIEKTLHLLGMPHARIAIHNQKQAFPGEHGYDHIEFLFNANKGQQMQEVARVASGGEKSRLMLAIKSLISQKSLLPTIIFDEIDAGVSGAVADKTGQILSSLSENMQVFAITHLPQIAGFGNDHLMVFKDTRASMTQTSLKRLNRDERIIEIAKLLSGQQITDASVESARHLLKN